jgi:sugar/nucleoside kinase (ribokinase family)
MKRILTIGDLFLDIIPSAFPVEKERILHDGESFVDNVIFQRGGCAGNFVAVLKSVFNDFRVEFISKIGDDFNGNFLIDEMKRYGVEPRFVVGKGESTAITIAVSFKDGERHFLTQLGAMDTFKSEDISRELFKHYDHVAYRGIWFARHVLYDAVSILKSAKDAGASTSMDLGFDPLWALNHPDVPKRKQSALNAIKYVDFLFGNQKEFMTLTDTCSMDDAISVLRSYKANTLVVHMGSKGAKIVGPNDIIDVPVFKVDVKNPVGSGDTFDAVFIGSLLEAFSIRDAGLQAAAAAAYSISNAPGTKLSRVKLSEFVSTHCEK